MLSQLYMFMIRQLNDRREPSKQDPLRLKPNSVNSICYVSDSSWLMMKGLSMNC